MDIRYLAENIDKAEQKTFFDKENSPFDSLKPIAIIPKRGITTEVIQKPKVAIEKLLPASWPIWTGKIKLPAPKVIPNKVEATTISCFQLSLFFVIRRMLRIYFRNLSRTFWNRFKRFSLTYSIGTWSFGLIII